VVIIKKYYIVRRPESFGIIFIFAKLIRLQYTPATFKQGNKLNSYMKKVLFLLAIMASVSTFAQTKQKFGHINSNELLQAMPENNQAKEALQQYTKELETQLMSMQAELEQKYTDYLAKKDSLLPLIQKNRETELNDLNARIQQFQQTAQQELQNKEMQLLQPIIEKARNAIREVSKEKEYTYVFDTSTGALVYWPEGSDDLMPLVKAKLGM